MVGISGMGVACFYLTKRDVWLTINAVSLASFFVGKEFVLLHAGLNATYNRYGLPFINKITNMQLSSHGNIAYDEVCFDEKSNARERG